MKTNAKPFLMGLLVAVFFSAAPQTLSAAIFLLLPNIPGESNDDRHADWIDITSVSFGVTQSGIRSAGGRASAARSNFSVITATKNVDKSSPLLFLRCATGEHLPNATLAFASPDGSVDYLTIKLTDVIISSYQSSAEDGQVSESVSLSFSVIEFSYRPQLPSGGFATPITVVFDVNRNKSVTTPQ